MTLRIDDQMAREIDVARRVLGVSAADFIRAAITVHLDAERLEPGVQARAAELLERNRAALDESKERHP